MTTVRPKEWTYEEFMALPEGGPLRYEVIDGGLTMPPVHPSTEQSGSRTGTKAGKKRGTPK